MISIIIPVYNAEKYLPDCLDSVREQTFQDWEVILVNDGSTDGSGELCRKYCQADDRFRYFEQDNQGVSVARNTGMKECRGDYLFFVDADDTILSNTLADVYATAQETNADLVTFQYQKVTQETDIQAVNCVGVPRICSGDEALQLFLKEQLLGVSIWGKLIHRSDIETITFEAGRTTHEDKYFLFEVLCHAKKVAILNEPYYCYWTRENSITTKSFSQRWFDEYYFAEKIYSVICSHKPEFEAEARYQVLSVCYFLIRYMDQLKVGQQFSREYRVLCKRIRQIKICDIWNMVAHQRRLGIIIIKYFPPLYHLMKHVA